MVWEEINEKTAYIQARSSLARAMEVNGKTQENCVGSISSTPRIRNSRKPKNARKKLETSVAPAMPFKIMKNCGSGGSDKHKRKFACILEANESTRMRMGNSIPSVHFASIMDICHLKNAELKAKHQKYKGRVVLRGDIVKDNSGSYAVFTEQGSSASQMTAAKIMDIISTLLGCDGQAADAVSAYTQVKMEDAHKLLKIPKSDCPDIWIRLPRHKWPKSWSSMED